MLKVFSFFRVTLLSPVGEKKRFCFTNKKDADWFASHFENPFLDVIYAVSFADCLNDDEKENLLDAIRYGSGKFSELM